MRETVTLLLELQELELVLEESRIVHHLQPLEALVLLEQRVKDMRSAVPNPLLQRYDRLRRNGLGVAREEGGNCSGCHLHVPQGDLNRMRRAMMPWVCPNCARFLLLSSRS